MDNYWDWFYRIPFFTRYWLTFTVAISVLARFNYLNAEYLILRHYPFFEEFQIWRPITALFYFPVHEAMCFQLLINCYFVYAYSSRLETGIFSGKPAEYFTLLYFNWIVCTAVGLVMGLQYLMEPMVMSVLYTWCQLNKDVGIAFFGSSFQASYLPWLLLALTIVVKRGGMTELIGILVGHLGFFLMFKYPEDLGGAVSISPPAFLKKILPDFRTMGGIEPGPTPAHTRQRGRGDTIGGH